MNALAIMLSVFASGLTSDAVARRWPGVCAVGPALIVEHFDDFNEEWTVVSQIGDYVAATTTEDYGCNLFMGFTIKPGKSIRPIGYLSCVAGERYALFGEMRVKGYPKIRLGFVSKYVSKVDATDIYISKYGAFMPITTLVGLCYGTEPMFMRFLLSSPQASKDRHIPLIVLRRLLYRTLVRLEGPAPKETK